MKHTTHQTYERMQDITFQAGINCLTYEGTQQEYMRWFMIYIACKLQLDQALHTLSDEDFEAVTI